MEMRQEMNNFMHNEDSTNYDDNSVLSNTSSDLVPSASLQILYPIPKSNIKKVLHAKKQIQKQTKIE